MPVYRPSELQAFMASCGRPALKFLSQNFLIDGNIVSKILQAAEVKEGDFIVEIGPGPGVLTEALLAKGAQVLAIEKDTLLAKELRRLCPDEEKLQIYTGDFLEFPLESLPKNSKIVANLPYHITTPILQKCLPLSSLSSLTIMVQKEVGERLTAARNTPMYSSFTLFAQFYSTVTYCFTVNASCFYPKPSVDSCVVHFTLKNCPTDDQFFTLTRRSFQQRRKMLRVSLKELFPSIAIEKALEKLGHCPEARPQELSCEDFKNLAACLFSIVSVKQP